MSKAKKEVKQDTSQKIYQREKINFPLSIRELPWTEKQKAFLELATNKDTRIIFLSGPAGSSKTTIAVRAGLQLLDERKMSDIIFVRAAVESADSKLGHLPGDISEKLGPYMGPFDDKLEELLPEGEIKKLMADLRLNYKPINFCRGASWTAKFVIVDEAQNLTLNELQTLMTRCGKFTKMIVCADESQSDLPYNKQGGFATCLRIFDTLPAQEHGIYAISFTSEDIVRSALCKFVVETFESHKKNTKALVETLGRQLAPLP